MNKFFGLLAMLFAAFPSFSQLPADLKHADHFFLKKEYYNAQVNYELYLGLRNSSSGYSPYDQRKKSLVRVDSVGRFDKTIFESKLINPKIAFQLSESYRNTYHYINAEKCYAKLLSLKDGKSTYPIAGLWYAVCLRCNKKFNEAKSQLQNFISENSSNAALVALAKKELSTLAFIEKELANEQQKMMTVKRLKGNIAQAEGAYAPVFFNDTLVFTSARIIDTVNRYSHKNMHVNHLFMTAVKNKDSVVGQAAIIKFPSLSSLNEGTGTFTPNKSRLYFARNLEFGESHNVAIYESIKREDGSWGEPVKLPDPINVAGAQSMQPSVSGDGKYLLFASDRNGGKGKFDIWAASIANGGSFGAPFNLQSINTEEDDQAPYYHVPTQTLVFSSKGYPGMGGFDIFASKGSLTTLKTPYNLGHPVNSPKDDNYFFSTSADSLLRSAYISSDRNSDCCLEVFSLTQKQVPPRIFKHSIVGQLVDCDTKAGIPNATAKVESNKGKPADISTDDKGNYKLEKAEDVTSLNWSADDYLPKAMPFAKSQNLKNDTIYNIGFCLVHKPKTVEQVKDSLEIEETPLIIYFDFAKAAIKDEAHPVLDKVVGLLKKYPTLSVSLEINGYTDSRGSEAYNLRLSKRRAEACREFLIKAGIEKQRLGLNAYGKASPVAPNTLGDKDNPEGRALNRRVEMKVKAKK